MAVAYAHYILFLDKDGNYINGRSYQNFFVGETRSYEARSYSFAPFAIVGLNSGRNGDVGQASLITTPNEITVQLFAEIILNKWLAEISTVSLLIRENQSFTESVLISREIWACVGGNSDVEKITVTLSSPLNATLKEIPGRVLTRAMVGAIPPTGQIVLS